MTPLSFAAYILPLFRPGDIDAMKPYGIDLSSYEDVKRRAKDVYGRLSAKEMPCDEPWRPAEIGRFKKWMEGGLRP
jgi:hypothetical protein